MGTFHHDKHELHGITVIVDTTGPEIYIGRCDDIVAQGVILRDADVHREGQLEFGGKEPRRVPRPRPAIRCLAESEAHSRSGGDRARDPSSRRNLKRPSTGVRMMNGTSASRRR